MVHALPDVVVALRQTNRLVLLLVVVLLGLLVLLSQLYKLGLLLLNALLQTLVVQVF